MYCDKYSVNLLTSYLYKYGVRNVVICPGARNGILAHNFNELATADANFRLHSVTDERSAAFVALGICLACECAPVAVCVTSGSALLGTLPAVAEAYYRHLPLLVLSADRPPEWIDQLDGQTLPQEGRLLPFAATFSLPEAHDDAAWRQCQSVVGRAFAALTNGGNKLPFAQTDERSRPVHINIPLSEPLFKFTTVQLPECQLPIDEMAPSANTLPAEVITRINNARLPVLHVGQMDRCDREPFERIEKNNSLLILSEIVANLPFGAYADCLDHHPDMLKAFSPDLVVHIGGNLVGKNIKLHLRGLENCEVIRIDCEQKDIDTFGHLILHAHCETNAAVRQLADHFCDKKPHVLATKALCRQARRTDLGLFTDQQQILLDLKRHLTDFAPESLTLHLANSTIVRDAARIFHDTHFPIFCNRGLNGIEGSMSTAVGAAIAGTGLHLLLIGDLSFFYDVNALWNTALPTRLRIILFNNGGGDIFNRLPGLEKTPARDNYIAARHNTSARGICEAFGLHHIEARSAEEAAACFSELLKTETDRAVLLEVTCQSSKRVKSFG